MNIIEQIKALPNEQCNVYVHPWADDGQQSELDPMELKALAESHERLLKWAKLARQTECSVAWPEIIEIIAEAEKISGEAG